MWRFDVLDSELKELEVRVFLVQRCCMLRAAGAFESCRHCTGICIGSLLLVIVWLELRFVISRVVLVVPSLLRICFLLLRSFWVQDHSDP